MSLRVHHVLLLRVLAITALLASGLSALHPVQAQTGEDAMDLVAMLPRTDDYAATGLDGVFTRNGGTCYTPDQFAIENSESLGMDVDELADAIEAMGLIASCDAYHALAEDPAAPPAPTVSFLSYVYQFEDEDGALEGFELFEDESADPGSEDLEDVETIGDVSEATVASGEDEDGPFQLVDITFVSGNLIGGIVLFDGTGAEPDLDLTFELAGELLDRMESVADGEAPHLGRMIAPMEGEGLPVPGTQRYELLDGNGEWRAGESEEVFEQRLESYGSAENVYSMGQVIPGPSEDDPGYTYAVIIHEFPSDEDAVAYVDDAVDALGENEFNSDVTELEDAPQYGDASVTVTYSSTANNTTAMLERVYTAVDNYVINLYVAGEMVPAGVTEHVMETQVACVEDGGCSETVQVPAALGGEPADDASTDEDAEDEDTGVIPGRAIGRTQTGQDEDDDQSQDGDTGEDERAADGDTFASDLYPYSITYGPEWTMEEPQVLEDAELVALYNDVSGVIIIVDTMHEGDVEACLDNAIAYVEDDPEVSNVQAIEDEDGEPIEGSDGDTAFAAISYETSDGGEMALYAECRVVVEGEVTMEFNQFVPLADFEDEADARDELLAGIEIGD